jgi:hypothetical protein
MARKQKTYPQVVALEFMLAAACGTGAYFLADHLGPSHSVAEFLAGMATATALRMVLRHRNKRLLPKSPFKVTRTAPKRRSAPRRRSA